MTRTTRAPVPGSGPVTSAPGKGAAAKTAAAKTVAAKTVAGRGAPGNTGSSKGAADKGAADKGTPGKRKARPAPQRWTQEKQARFLANLAATANVAASVRACGMSETAVYGLRARSGEFRAAWEAALAEGYRRLELMLLERAMNGTVKPVFYGGAQVGSITEYPDRLALSLLSAHREAVVHAHGARGEDEATVRARMADKLAEMSLRMGRE